MSDTPVSPEVARIQQEQERKERVARIVELVEALAESHESLPFYGISDERYEHIKRDEAEYPGFTTPIDVVLQRCREEGIKIVLSDIHPDSGNVFVLPARSNNIVEDSLLLELLLPAEGMPYELKELLALKKR